MRKTSLLLIGALVLMAGTGVAGEGFAGRLHYVTGDRAPGTGSGPLSSFAKFASFASPQTNRHGAVAFAGVLEGEEPRQRGIWLIPEPGAEAELVVLEGDVAPVFPEGNFLPGKFSALELLGLDDAGRIIFASAGIPVSKYPAAAKAIYLWEPAGGGQVRLVLASGYGANGRTLSEGVFASTDPDEVPYRLGSIARIQVSPDGVISFLAEYGTTSPFNANGGMWRIPDPAVADLTNVFPDPVFLSVDAPELAGFDIVVDTGTEMEMEAWLVVEDAADGGEKIYQLATGASAPQQSSGDPAPGLAGAKFTYLGRPAATAGGQLAFWAETDSADMAEGIWVKRDGGYFLLAGSTAAIGGSGPIVSELSDPVVNKNKLVGFKAQYLAGGEGIWLGNSSSSLVNAVESGLTPTGRGSAEFVRLGNPVLNDRGQVLFSALVDDGSGAKFGFWVMTSVGCVVPVLVVGDQLSLDPFDVAAVKHIRISDLSAAGFLAMVVEFADGRTSLISVQLEPATPAGYDAWSAIFIQDPADRDPAADLDLDGRSNLAEFAFGTDPERFDLAPDDVLQQSFITDDESGESFLQFSARVRSGVGADVIYEVEQSLDLNHWLGQADLIEIQSVPAGGGFDTLTLRQAAPVSAEQRRYTRLRVMPPAE